MTATRTIGTANGGGDAPVFKPLRSLMRVEPHGDPVYPARAVGIPFGDGL